MYKVTFWKVDKKISRSIKALKSKSGHSLREADQLLKAVYEIISGQTKLTLIVSDLENELDYNFEDITINKNDEPPKLMEILEEDIIASGHEDAQKLISELERQYRIEGSTEDETNKETQLNRTSRGGLNLFGKLKKRSKNNHVEPANNDNEELEESTSVQSSIEDDFDDFDELNNNLDEFDGQDGQDVQENVFENTNEFVSTEDYSNSSEKDDSLNNEEIFPFNLNGNGESDQVEEKESVIIEAESDTPQYNTPKEIKQKKHEKVIFPAYNDYLDLSAMNSTINRNKERFEKMNLIKYLGLNALSIDTASTDLEKMKLEYALNALDGSKFVLLKDYFCNSVDNIKDKIHTHLSHAYEQALSYNYQEEATNNNVEEFQKLYEESESVFSNYQKEEEEKYLIKLEKFEHEQEKALEDFKKQQSIAKSIFIQELDDKMSSRIALYKDNMQSELNAKKEMLLDEKMYELKNASINQLTETKRRAIRNFETELENTIDETWINTQEALNELKDNIEAQIPKWKTEIEEIKKIESAEREERRKQEQLKLEKERIELQRKQLELKINEKKQETSHSLEELLEKKFLEYDEKLNSKLLLKQMELEPVKQVEQLLGKEQKQKINSRKKKNMMAGAVITLVITVGGFFAGQLVTGNQDIAKADQVSQYQKLADRMNVLEEKLYAPTVPSTVDEKGESNVSLEELLNAKNYEKAMSTYKDQESLNKIEEALYVNRDLATLITFNKVNDTALGQIDEAVLSKNANKAIELYKKMSTEDKKKLTSQRKSDIALLLYQKNKNKLAKELLKLKSDQK